jgi:hypothetical protein
LPAHVVEGENPLPAAGDAQIGEAVDVTDGVVEDEGLVPFLPELGTGIAGLPRSISVGVQVPDAFTEDADLMGHSLPGQRLVANLDALVGGAGVLPAANGKGESGHGHELANGMFHRDLLW